MGTVHGLRGRRGAGRRAGVRAEVPVAFVRAGLPEAFRAPAGPAPDRAAAVFGAGAAAFFSRTVVRAAELFAVRMMPGA